MDLILPSNVCFNLFYFSETLTRCHILIIKKISRLTYNDWHSTSLNSSYIFPISLANLEKLASQWGGFMSASILATDEEAHKLLQFTEKSTILKNRENIFFHIVYRTPSYVSRINISKQKSNLIKTFPAVIRSILIHDFRPFWKASPYIIRLWRIHLRIRLCSYPLCIRTLKISATLWVY